MKRFNYSSLPKLTNLRKHGFLAIAVAVSLTGWLLAQDPNRDVPAPPTPITDPAVPNAVPEVVGTGPGDVLTRGPIHEAFAKPVSEETKAPAVVPKAPPAMIEELPPDERPVGENVLWIPGYYAWDDDRLDFIWISGVYRDTPPGHTWVSGYWNAVPNGSQWVPGFWTTVATAAPNQQAQTEVEYLPEPPASLEQGPSTASPGESHFWIPGNWRYVDNRYAWQAGYWSAGQVGWIWVPAHYNWTPLGFVYTPGYWDYSLSQRGLAFAPVFFDAAYYANPVVYQPTVVLRPNFLTVHLWSRPRYCHYYFGDYYGNNYVTAGYRPWFTPLVANRAYYDPLFTYYSWQGRRVDPNWNRHIQQRYDFVMNHPDARPPRTYRDQYRLAQQPQYKQYVNNANIVNSSNTIIELGNNPNGNRHAQGRPGFGTEDDIASLQIQNAAMTANLAQVATQQKQVTQAPLQLEKVNADTRDRFSKQAKQFREIAAQRQQLAGAAVPGAAVPGIAKGGVDSKFGGGKTRLPVVQPIVSVNQQGTTPRTGAVANPIAGDSLIPLVTPAEKGRMVPGRGNPANNTATSPSGQPTTGSTAADNMPTERNPNKLGRNVPPNPVGGVNSAIGGVAVPGGVDTVVVPLDIVTPGTGPVVNNQGNPVGQNGTSTNGNPNNGTPGPSNSPNTTATTVPGQRTPANGAFGQDQGPLVPPGQLAPGQQNPEVFNPKVGDASNSAFKPTIGNPNTSTNENNGPNTNTTTNNGPTGTTPNTTATTVPGQRTPAGGAFGQDQGPLVPPGQLAPGQQNPEVFNPKVGDQNNSTFNPKIGNPNTSSNTSTNPQTNNANGSNAGTTGTTPNTTANTVPGQRTPAGGAFGQNQGPLAPPGQLAPGQQNPEVFNPKVGDQNNSTFNPKIGNPNASSNTNTNPPTNNPNGSNAGTTGTTPNTTANTVPGQRTPAGGAFGQNQGPLAPPGQLAPGQQKPGVFNPKVGDQNNSTFNPKIGNPNSSSSTKGTNNAGANPTKNKGNNAAGNSIPGTNLPNRNKSGNALPSKGNPGNDNPVLGNGVSAGPKINPNQGALGGNPGGGNVGSKNNPVTKPPLNRGNPGGNRNPGNKGGAGGNVPPVGPGVGGGVPSIPNPAVPNPADGGKKAKKVKDNG